MGHGCIIRIAIVILRHFVLGGYPNWLEIGWALGRVFQWLGRAQTLFDGQFISIDLCHLHTPMLAIDAKLEIKYLKLRTPTSIALRLTQDYI